MAESIYDGITLYKERRYKEALALFLSLPNNDSSKIDTSEMAYYIGLTYARLERYDESLMYLEQVVTSDTSGKRVNQCRLSLAVIYSLTGRNRLADFELHKLLDSGYQTAEVYSALAYIQWEQSNPSDSVKYYEKALELNPNSTSALNGLGYVLACLGRDLTRALSLCKKAVDRVPDSPAFLDSLGWVYHKLGLQSEAKNYIKRARDKNPNSKEINNHYQEVIANAVATKENDRLSARGNR